MSKPLNLLAAVAAAFALMAVPNISYAEDCETDEKKKDDGKNFHIEERNGEKVYVIDKVITVCGKVPRPSVVYVLQAKSINYAWESLKRDFLPKILNSVKRSPF